MCALHAWRVLGMHFVCTLHSLKSTLGGNDQGIALSLLTLVFRFDVIFHRCFSGRFCKGNEHLWCHVNKETVDFHILTFEREMGMALDVLHTGYCLRILMYMLDELFFVFKKLQANDFDAQCMVAYEILQIALHQCTEQHRSKKKKENTLGDTYPWVDFRDADSLERLAWAMYNRVFMPGNKPALSGCYNWDRVVAGTLIHLIFWGQTDKEHCGPTTVASYVKWTTELAQQQGLPQHRERRAHTATVVSACKSPTVQSKVTVLPQAMSSCSMGGAQVVVLDYAADSNEESPFPRTSQCLVMKGSPRKV